MQSKERIEATDITGNRCSLLQPLNDADRSIELPEACLIHIHRFYV
jgi:hypothetical protein